MSASTRLALLLIAALCGGTVAIVADLANGDPTSPPPRQMAVEAEAQIQSAPGSQQPDTADAAGANGGTDGNIATARGGAAGDATTNEPDAHAHADADAGGDADADALRRLFAAGGGNEAGLWVVLRDPDEARYRLLLRRPDEAEPVARQLLDSAGVPAAVTAYRQRVILAYADGAAQAITFGPSRPAAAPTARVSQLPPLPDGAELVDLAATANGPVALIRTASPPPLADEPEGQADVDRTDNATEDGANGDAEADGETDAQDTRDEPGRPGADETPETDTAAAGAGTDSMVSANNDEPGAADSDQLDQTGEGEVEQDTQADVNGEARPEPRPGLALIRIVGSEWRSLPLPSVLADAPPTRAVRVVMVDAGARKLALVTPGRAKDAGQAVVFTRIGAEPWSRQAYALPLGDAFATAVVNDYLVLVTERSADQLGAFVLHPDGSVVPLGPMGTPDATEPWAAAGMGRFVYVIHVDDNGQLHATRRDINARPDGPAATEAWTVEPWPLPPISRDMFTYGLVAIAVLAAAIAVWRRDPRAGLIELPDELTPAEVWRRAAAGLIDLAPAVVVTMIVFGTFDPLVVIGPLVAPPEDPMLMLPAYTAVGLFVIYSMAIEMATGKTLGKRLIGCRVVTNKGAAAHRRQIVVRNLVKAIELAFWPLLMFVLLDPATRRLGDSLARTVVVKEPPPQPPEDGEKTEAAPPAGP